MSVQITIRNVPDEIRDALARQARSARKSMQEYLLGEFERLAQRPTLAEWLDRVQSRKADAAIEVAAEEILGARDADRR